MQKISTYLYPNRIQLLADLAGFTVEYTNVYQKTVKLFKGISNTIELDVKNADQKRIDLTGLTIKFNLMDTEGNQILLKTATALDQTTLKGLAKVTIPATDLANLKHNFFKYSVYTEAEDGTQTLLYGDTRFGAKGTAEVVGDAMPAPQPDRVTTTFNPLSDVDGTIVWTSQPLSVQPNSAVVNGVTTIGIYCTGLNGTVEVQASLDPSITNSTLWTTIDTISVNSNDTIINQTYTGMFCWFRLVYTNGSTTYAPVAGTVDKLIVRS